MEAGRLLGEYCNMQVRDDDGLSTVKAVGAVRHGCILDVLKTESTIFANRLDLRHLEEKGSQI